MKNAIEILNSELQKLENKRAGYLKDIKTHQDIILSLNDNIKNREKAIYNIETKIEENYQKILEMRESIEKLR